MDSHAANVCHLPTREGYDRWASIYDDDGNPLVALEQPHVDQLLGDIQGLKIADIGCGTGRHAIRLANRGACVTALDFSEQMLAKAKAKQQSMVSLHRGAVQPIHFIQHDLAEALPMADRVFDRVLCSLVLEHISPLQRLFSEMKRICSSAGSIVVSNLHPAMMLKGVSARFTDPDTGRETRPASCSHQVSDYVLAALGAGLTIDHLGEHVVDADLAARWPRAEKYLGWPMLFMMRLRP